MVADCVCVCVCVWMSHQKGDRQVALRGRSKNGIASTVLRHRFLLCSLAESHRTRMKFWSGWGRVQTLGSRVPSEGGRRGIPLTMHFEKCEMSRVFNVVSTIGDLNPNCTATLPPPPPPCAATGARENTLVRGHIQQTGVWIPCCAQALQDEWQSELDSSRSL